MQKSAIKRKTDIKISYLVCVKFYFYLSQFVITETLKKKDGTERNIMNVPLHQMGPQDFCQEDDFFYTLDISASLNTSFLLRSNAMYLFEIYIPFQTMIETHSFSINSSF